MNLETAAQPRMNTDRKTASATRAHTSDLRLALQHLLSQHFERQCRIESLRRRRSLYSSSCSIENLEVELPRGRRLSLVFKDLSPEALLKTAREVRPRFLYDPLREIETYRVILDSDRFGTAVCYGAIHHPDFQRYWLFLERVKGPLLWQVGQMERWREAVRWMAGLHSEFDVSRYSANQAQLAHLLRYDRQFFGIWLDRAESLLRARRADRAPAQWRQFTRLAGRYHRVIDRLLALPQTLIHGEFYPSNIILRDTGKKRRICPIDWEAAAIAPGIMDLAALTSGDWTTDQRRELVAAYRDALEPVKGWPPPMPELLELVDCGQLHLAMQWLGWAADWSPPKMHARNWLAEVLRLAQRLGL